MTDTPKVRDWYALPRCPKCLRVWQCWTVHRNYPSRPMKRPHWERVRRG